MTGQKKILIVDDEEKLVKTIGARLEASGFEVLKALSGEQGIRIAIEGNVDLVLLDILMPDMDGYQVLKKIRENPAAESLCIVMFSGGDEVLGRKTALAMGADDYLNKGIPFEDLLQRLRQLLYES